MVVVDEVGVEEGAEGSVELLVRLRAAKEGLPFLRVDEHLLGTDKAFDELWFLGWVFSDGGFYILEVLDRKVSMSPSLVLQ